MNSSVQKFSFSRTPMNAVPTEVIVVPEMPKVGFGYRCFDSTSITAVIPKHEIIRPMEVQRIKKLHIRKIGIKVRKKGVRVSVFTLSHWKVLETRRSREF